MKTGYSSIALLITLMLMTQLVSFGYQAKNAKGDEVWFNFPSSPLRIGRTANERFFTLTNQSSSRVIEYKLGCIAQKADKVVIVRKMQAQKTNLSAADSSENSYSFESFDQNILKYYEVCKLARAKIGIIEVIFEDGSIWKANH